MKKNVNITDILEVGGDFDSDNDFFIWVQHEEAVTFLKRDKVIELRDHLSKVLKESSL